MTVTTQATMTFAEINEVYTWGTLLPLPGGAKKPVPAGTTGRTAPEPEPDTVASWAGRTGNVALRMDADVIGIDVDDYGDKHGADTLREMEARLGELPETPIISRHTDPERAGTRFFRRHSTEQWGGAVGKDIDMIQRGHRYSVVWPSTVPDAAGETHYFWYDAYGQRLSLPPAKEDLAWLPEAWEQELGRNTVAAGAAPAAASDTAAFRADMEADGREVCEGVDKALTVWVEKFEAVSEGSHHDTMLKATHAVIAECAQGHPGFTEAVNTLSDLWESAGLGADREDEFWSMVNTAVAKAAGKHGTYKPKTGSDHICGGGPRPAPAAVTGGSEARTIIEMMEVSNDTDRTWVDELAREPGKTTLAKSYDNTAAIMDRDPVLRWIGRDTMSGKPAWRKMPPWRTGGIDPQARWDWTLRNADLVRVRALLASYYGGSHTAISADTRDEAVALQADLNEFSPWRDYLDRLPAWDGTDRMRHAIPTLLAETPQRAWLNEQMLGNFFLGMMQRAYEPGSQVDSLLVLVGGQGYRKSSWFRRIVPHEVFYEELTTVPDSSSTGKDLMIAAHKSAVVVFDEIDKLRRVDEQAALKAFITQRVDTWRAPYQRVDESHARQFVLGGTSNNDNFLLDTTGNRRYWVLQVEDEIPAEVMTRDFYEQVLAEAKARYEAGERVNYSREFEDAAEIEREGYTSDPIGEAVYSWLDDPVDTTAMTGSIAGVKMGKVDISRVSVHMLATYVPELSVDEVMKRKAIADHIADAMDRHPGYKRIRGQERRIAGHKTKKFWEIII